MQLNAQQKRRNLALTLVQYSFLPAFLLMGPLLCKSTALLIIQVFGVLLGLWAIAVMSKGKVHIAPRPRAGAVLVQKGPYGLIRHPMYTAILLYSIPLLVDTFQGERLVVFLILMANLMLKLLFEESLLLQYFPDYASYRKKTWRIIPGIF